MSNVIVILQRLNEVGVFNGVVALRRPFLVPGDGRNVLVRCDGAEISDLIPNIFNGYPFNVLFNNSKMRVGNNIDGWVTIQFDPGRYEAIQLNAAINAAINSMGWWADPNDPGFTLSGNSIIQKHTILMDSTKLAPAHGTQFWVDISNANGSDLYYSLGYNPTDVFLVDGLYDSPNFPQMDSQGTQCLIETSFVATRRFNDEDRPILADASFAGKTTFSNIVWPQAGQISPWMTYVGPKSLNEVRISVKTSSGVPMIFLGGILKVCVSFGK